MKRTSEMKIVTLLKSIKFNTFENLVGLGGYSDGEYLVSKADVDSSTLILGCGINADGEFEKTMKDLTPVRHKLLTCQQPLSCSLGNRLVH